MNPMTSTIDAREVASQASATPMLLQLPRFFEEATLLDEIVPGCSERLLEAFPRLSLLIAATAPELIAAGLAPSEASRLASAFEFCRRAGKPQDAGAINSPDDAALALLPLLSHLDHERMVVLALDRRYRVIVEIIVAEGGIDRAQIDSRLLFGRLLRVGATAAVLGHNHPSGDPTPSPGDVKTTNHLGEVAELLDIEILDHVVVAGEQWISLKQSGLWAGDERMFALERQVG